MPLKKVLLFIVITILIFCTSYDIGSGYTELFSRAVLELSESGRLASIRDTWWPEPGTCQSENNSGIPTRAPPPMTLDLYHMATPFIFLAVSILVTFIIAAMEIFNDNTIVSIPKYLRQKLRFSPAQYTREDTCVNHVATQTILWASSRANSPAPGGIRFIYFF